jgi:para-nitrobenzyl esterase
MRKLHFLELTVLSVLAFAEMTFAQDVGINKPLPVTVSNFVRAESDYYFGKTVKQDGFGKLSHTRQMVPIDKQDVIRMDRDALYSSGVFDLKASPLTIILPDAGKRFMFMQVISEDHYTVEVVYTPGPHVFTEETVGTRYVLAVIRIFADPRNPDDITVANTLQDAIKVEQPTVGEFDVPNWDPVSQTKIRDALSLLFSMSGDMQGAMFGSEREVDPIRHLIGTAVGWGGNPTESAFYQVGYPTANDGKVVHKLTTKDVPVDGFWSISLYNAKGFFQKNDLDAYSINNLTAKPNPNGSITVQFGGCRKSTPNCLPIMQGWNYMVRLYRPRKEVINGSWKFPEARPGR